MADRRPLSAAAAVLRRIQEHAPHSPQLLGFLTLFISAAVLVFLTGLTITAAAVALILITPFILLTSPIWVPVGFLLFVATAVVLSLGGLALAAAAGLSWGFRYFKGMQPPGSERLEYARSRIYDTAREYGGYFGQSKVKDAAPGA
ncbi:oleosin 16 kDa [Momordica charantia]|uniref:Oleosin 16 kDa n=1 Tax=Momordica charantia TaxID=3673 RepID=A0A6J1BZY3_MOMCH|nr:oleosin 16 kDa [Momordica charantia]